MQRKKDNFLGKIVKKDYNNELEEVLEQKRFSEHTKSLLLNILYKIESAYPDYQKVKRDVETKEEFIKDIISIIQNDCNMIDVISPTSPRSQELGRRVYIIDKSQKIIKCYPVERKMLYAISKMGKKDYIIDSEKYSAFAKQLSDLINIGKSINTVEPLRDFNGYSWATIPSEIESVEHNLVYQNLGILVGYSLLNDWVKQEEFISDYMLLFRKSLSRRYGDITSKKIEDLVIKVAMLLDAKFNGQNRRKTDDKNQDVLNQLNILHDKQNFTENISIRKKEINNKIRYIDRILNDNNLLQSELIRKNQTLPEPYKITNLEEWKNLLIQERAKELSKIETLNKLLLPKNFIKYQKELEERENYVKLFENTDVDAELYEVMLELQKIFLECFENKIKRVASKADVEELIYQFRYYVLQSFSKNKLIYEADELQGSISKTLRTLIDRMKKEGIVGEFSKIPELELKIFKEIFTVRTINLDNIDVKIAKDKETGIICMYIYDGEEIEKRAELITANQWTKDTLGVKLGKKVRVFY